MDRTVDDAGQRSLAGQAADSVALKDLNRGPSPSMPMLVPALNQTIQDHGKDSSPPPLSPHFPFAQNPQIDDHTRPRHFPDPYPSGSKSAQYRFGYVGGDDGLANHGEGRRAGDWRSVTNGDEDGIHFYPAYSRRESNETRLFYPWGNTSVSIYTFAEGMPRTSVMTTAAVGYPVMSSCRNPPYVSMVGGRSRERVGLDRDCPALASLDIESCNPRELLQKLSVIDLSTEDDSGDEYTASRAKPRALAGAKDVFLDQESRSELAGWALEIAKGGAFSMDALPSAIRRHIPAGRGNSELDMSSPPVYFPVSRRVRELVTNTTISQSHRNDDRKIGRDSYTTNSDTDGRDSCTTGSRLTQRDKRRSRRSCSISRDVSSDSDSDSDNGHERSVVFEDEHRHRRIADNRPRRNDYIKLDRYDGTGSLEAFLAHFDNCRRYNGWSHSDSLSQLKASLKGAAAEVLFENEKSITLYQLRNELKDHFGNDGFQGEFETQLKTRRRQKGGNIKNVIPGCESPGNASVSGAVWKDER